MIKKLPEIETIFSAFDYDKEAGVLIWKNRPDSPKHINSTYAGKQAGCLDNKGYFIVHLNYKKYLVHRLIYKIETGEEPKAIDHIDGNPQNNRIDNLRPCSPSQNLQNAKLQSNNKTGARGVHLQAKSGKYIAKIKHKGKTIHLGSFETITEASGVYETKAKELHGEFFRKDVNHDRHETNS